MRLNGSIRTEAKQRADSRQVDASWRSRRICGRMRAQIRRWYGWIARGGSAVPLVRRTYDPSGHRSFKAYSIVEVSKRLCAATAAPGHAHLGPVRGGKDARKFNDACVRQ